jgi:hypothetical protein
VGSKLFARPINLETLRGKNMQLERKKKHVEAPLKSEPLQKEYGPGSSDVVTGGSIRINARLVDLGGIMVSVLPIRPMVRGFKPGRG